MLDKLWFGGLSLLVERRDLRHLGQIWSRRLKIIKTKVWITAWIISMCVSASPPLHPPHRNVLMSSLQFHEFHSLAFNSRLQFIVWLLFLTITAESKQLWGADFFLQPLPALTVIPAALFCYFLFLSSAFSFSCHHFTQTPLIFLIPTFAFFPSIWRIFHSFYNLFFFFVTLSPHRSIHTYFYATSADLLHFL